MPKTIDYRKAPGLNYSALKLIDKSPKHFKHFLDAGGTPDSAAYAQGRAMHSALLEPHKFNNDYIIQPPQFKMRSGKAWEAFLEANPDKTILKLDDYSSVLECARIVKEDPIAKKFFTKKFKFEHSIFWEYRGIACKSQLDISGPNLADYKSSIDVKPSEFCKSSWRYGYHVQFAFYQMAFEAETGER